MPVPSSGQLRLRADIALEVDGSASGTNVSLGTLADTAGFDTPPDTMQEFYGYSAFTAPTITGQTNASSVTSSSMRIYFNYSNPGGNNLKSRIWFGTSSTRTSNSVYDEGNSTATSREPARVFSGLTAGTTYYAWGELSDTQSPARFTTMILNQKTQATPLPSLEMGGSLGWGSIAGYVMYANAASSPCISSYGFGANQSASGQFNWTSGANTPSPVDMYGYCNWSPWSSLGMYSLLYTSPSSSGSTGWSATVNVGGVVNWPPGSASCGTGLTTYVRFSKSGYTTTYINNGGLRFGP